MSGGVSEAAKDIARRMLVAQYIDSPDGIATYIQQVSDALRSFEGATESPTLSPFILPEPVDPLAAAWEALWPEDTGIPGCAAALRAELAKRGLEIRKVRP